MQLRRLASLALVCLLWSCCAWAQKSKVELQTSETVFTVLTGINACGYNDDLAESAPVRNEVRTAVRQMVEKSSAAADAKEQLCSFYNEHKQADANRELSQYVSLALNMGPAPDFKLKVKEADLPPDAFNVLGFVPLVTRFYSAADIHKIWNEVQPRYEAILQKVNEPLANMILDTDVYLKNPISGYLGREFVIYVEPMAGPGQVNARNYGENYYLVTSTIEGSLPLDQVRHTYLHFVLDPLAQKRPAAMKRLDPVLKDIQTAPLDDSYKRDSSLLVTESLIRAIEARSIPGGKNGESRREREVADDMADGFVLTRYFYDSLVKFEAEPTALKDAFPDWLYYMDIPKLHKIASETQFASNARGEVVKKASKQNVETPLDQAEEKMRNGDLEAAEKIAEPIANAKGADAPRAEFILGEVATLRKDKENAIRRFEDTLRTAQDPRLIAWSHIYLGRIYDVDRERDMAVKHYQAALQAGDDSPQLKAAAKRGLESAYERKESSEQEQH